MRRNAKRLRSVLLGELSLLRACGEVWLQAGHEIAAVGSNNPDLEKWATEIGARPVRLQMKDLHGQLLDLQFDYLLSITNFKVLPEDVLELAAGGAINFHDGLLPYYAGLNVPCWAIIKGESEHGITWHFMTPEVDRGDVLVQERFDIEPDDTAFAINAKCYEAGLESFARLIGQLASDELIPQPQSPNIHYFGLRDRPPAQGILDPKQTAATLARQVRALDFGPYFNPMGLPKLWLGDRAIVVGTARDAGESTEAQPGTIVAIGDEVLKLAAGGEVIELGSLRGTNGAPASPAQLGLRVGDVLPALDNKLSDALSAEHRDSCIGESDWLETFQRVEWLDCPYLDNSGGALPGAIRYPIANVNSDETSRAVIFSLLVAYLARISRRTEFHMPVGFSPAGGPAALDELFCTQMPLEISVDRNNSLASMVEQTSELIDRHRNRPSFAWDLLLRAPDIETDRREYLVSGAPIGMLFADTDAGLDSERLVRNTPLQFVIDDGFAELIADGTRVSEETAKKIVAEISLFATAALDQPSHPVGELDFLTESDRDQLRAINLTDRPHSPECIHKQVEVQAAATPSETALVFRDDVLSYQELNERANRLAGFLAETGVQPGDLVGLMLERSPDMVIGLLAILKAGAAYVPMDPAYPAERLAYMAQDSGAKVIIASDHEQLPLGEESKDAVVVINELGERLSRHSSANPDVDVQPDSLCYVIYTSGSTGTPKGVMLEHRQVSNFLLGMDSRIAANGRGTWLAVTSISFDISVLELFWSLSRGFAVVLHREDEEGPDVAERLGTRHPEQPIEFGLFYWNVTDGDDSDDPDRYRLLIEGAKFADRNAFSAVWTPERHFGSFGGLYPNPSVTGAAVATITRNVGIRAGSCVVPLHHPIRIAEEWSVVDVLSGGRVGLSMASGWMPNDFVIKPENFEDAKTKLFEGIDEVRRLWRGETLTFPGPRGEVEVSTLPRPIQAELPVWVTAAGNPETFRQAAEAGANVLTHLLGQSIDELAEKIDLYRDTWRASGHAGDGHVTVMLHTFVGDDDGEIKELVRGPMKRYLKSALGLVKAAAWEFPTFKKMSEEDNVSLDDYFTTISDDDMEGLLDFAFERYYETSGLLGSKERCLATIDRAKEIGVDEIACLIDFGVEPDSVLRQLEELDELRRLANGEVLSDADDGSIPRLIERHNVTHFQCTPSMAEMLLWNPHARSALGELECMMVGGETFPETMAAELRKILRGRLLNMYGPTETTIWSTTADIEAVDGGPVPLGPPIANTELYVLDDQLRPVPIGIPGELVIGGQGVARGYLNRAELTAERFIEAPAALEYLRPTNASQTLYRTGDLVRLEADNTLRFLGRLDHQVKIRGFRIELGEIEAAMRDLSGIEQAVAELRNDTNGDPMLVAYYSLSSTANVIQTALRRSLRERLPRFMVPQSFVEVDEFPLTPNGKIDRRALANLVEIDARRDTEYELPESPMEEAVARIWSSLLGTDEIGRHDLFFDLGGHSLLAVRAASEIDDQLGVHIPPRLLLTVTLSQLAASCEALREELEGAKSTEAKPDGFARRIFRRPPSGAGRAD